MPLPKSNPAAPFEPEEIQEAADIFFPLFDIIHNRMPEGSTTEDTLIVMEPIHMLAAKLRHQSKKKARSIGFNNPEAPE